MNIHGQVMKNRTKGSKYAWFFNFPDTASITVQHKTIIWNIIVRIIVSWIREDHNLKVQTSARVCQVPEQSSYIS